MRKQLLLLLVLLPLSASAQTFQLNFPASFNLLDLLDRFNRDGGILPNIGQTYGPLTLNHLGEFRCPQCGSALSEAEQQNAARFASYLIFGKSRVVNIKDLGYFNLTPYIEGAKGLKIKLENDRIIEMRFDKAAESKIAADAARFNQQQVCPYYTYVTKCLLHYIIQSPVALQALVIGKAKAMSDAEELQFVK